MLKLKLYNSIFIFYIYSVIEVLHEMLYHMHLSLWNIFLSRRRFYSIMKLANLSTLKVTCLVPADCSCTKMTSRNKLLSISTQQSKNGYLYFSLNFEIVFWQSRYKCNIIFLYIKEKVNKLWIYLVQIQFWCARNISSTLNIE